MVDIVSLREKLRTAVNSQFAKPITISPYQDGQYMAARVPDNSRQVINTVGILISRSYAAIGALRAAGSLAFLSRRVEADYLLKVNEADVSTVKQNDHVYVSELGQTYEIAYMEEPAYGRRILHLSKIP